MTLGVSMLTLKLKLSLSRQYATNHPTWWAHGSQFDLEGKRSEQDVWRLSIPEATEIPGTLRQACLLAVHGNLNFGSLSSNPITALWLRPYCLIIIDSSSDNDWRFVVSPQFHQGVCILSRVSVPVVSRGDDLIVIWSDARKTTITHLILNENERQNLVQKFFTIRQMNTIIDTQLYSRGARSCNLL